MAASVGPTHGVQATAKAMPVRPAVASPPACGKGRRRSAAKSRGSGRPARVTAASRTKTPAKISKVRRFSSRKLPNQAAPAPRATNMAVNPATKAAVQAVTRWGRAPSSSKPIPETKER
jgi:hypothetical protein